MVDKLMDADVLVVKKEVECQTMSNYCHWNPQELSGRMIYIYIYNITYSCRYLSPDYSS